MEIILKSQYFRARYGLYFFLSPEILSCEPAILPGNK